MATEQDKAVVELAVFREFTNLAPFSIDDTSVEKRSGESEPDILCNIIGEGPVYFELVEICDPTLAATISYLHSGGVATTQSTSDPSIEIIRRKLHKSYNTALPVELLCYTNGRVMTTDDAILSAIRPWFDAIINNPFRRVWLLGEKDTYEVWRTN